MSFMKSWKLKQPGTASVTNTPKIAAFSNPQVNMSPGNLDTPESNDVEMVKPADNQMTKFNGLKRKLAHYRNGFKDSKD